MPQIGMSDDFWMKSQHERTYRLKGYRGLKQRECEGQMRSDIFQRESLGVFVGVLRHYLEVEGYG